MKKYAAGDDGPSLPDNSSSSSSLLALPLLLLNGFLPAPAAAAQVFGIFCVERLQSAIPVPVPRGLFSILLPRYPSFPGARRKEGRIIK